MSNNVTEAKKALIRAIVFDGYHTTRMQDADVGDHIIAKLGGRLDALITRASQQSVPNSVVEAERIFMDIVWKALKSDANDLRKQQRILKAYRALSKQSGQTEAECRMCDGTGFKDYAGFAMEPCDHAHPNQGEGA